MKQTFLFILLIFILIFPVSDPARPKEDYPRKTKDFWDSIDKLEERFDLSTGTIIKEFTPAEVKDIARKYIEAKFEDPISFKKYMIKKHEEKKIKMMKENNRNHLLALYIMNKIMECIRLDPSYPEHFVSIMKPDFLIKIRIVKKYRSTYDTYLAHDGYTGIVEDVLRGNSRFHKGDVLDFSAFSYSGDSPGVFKEGMTYLIPLRWEGQGGVHDYCVVSLEDNCRALYPLIDNKLVAPGNVFQLGDNITWEKFKAAFINTYYEMNF